MQKSNSHLGYNAKLELLDCIYCKDYFGLEKYIHSRFKDYRKINEWFDITRVDILKIKEEIDLNKYNQYSKDRLIGYKSFFYFDDINLITEGLFSRIIKLSKNNKLDNWLDVLMIDLSLKERALKNHLKILSNKNIIHIKNNCLYINPLFFTYKPTVDDEIKNIFKLDSNKIDTKKYMLVFHSDN